MSHTAGPQDSESRRWVVLPSRRCAVAAAAVPLSSSSRDQRSRRRWPVKETSAGWCGRERSDRHGPVRLDWTPAEATVARWDGERGGTEVSAVAARWRGRTPRGERALRAAAGSEAGWGWLAPGHSRSAAPPQERTAMLQGSIRSGVRFR